MLTHSIQLIDSSRPSGFSTGCDFSGDIVALGDKAKASGFKVGDAVSGMVSSTKDNGAFQGKTSAHYPDNVAYFILLSFRVCRDSFRPCKSVIENQICPLISHKAISTPGLPYSDAAAAPVAMSTATLVRQAFLSFQLPHSFQGPPFCIANTV